jgi:DNA-directed RNA polymerase specialized sigma54-like protein
VDLEQSQTLQPQISIAITANLISSLKILQLSSEELQQTIEQEMVDNPALEVEERETCSVCGSPMQDGRCPECVPEASSAAESVAAESTAPLGRRLLRLARRHQSHALERRRLRPGGPGCL